MTYGTQAINPACRHDGNTASSMFFFLERWIASRQASLKYVLKSRQRQGLLSVRLGLVIAYVLPGFVCLAGASRFSNTVAGWMSIAPAAEPSVGSFLYVALGSLGAGMVCSSFRWALIDTLHHRTGVERPSLDFSKLQVNLDAFQLAVEHNYHYYQFHASMLLAVLFYGAVDQWVRGLWPILFSLAAAVLEITLLATSRDCLRRYYVRIEQLLSFDFE